MAAHAVEFTGQFPALDTTALRYARGSTDLAEAAALLQRLHDYPELAGRLTATSAQDAWDAIDYPERLEERTRRSPSAGHAVGLDAITAWLDQAAAVLPGTVPAPTASTCVPPAEANSHERRQASRRPVVDG